MTTGFAKQIHAGRIGMNVIQTTRMTSTDARPTEKIQGGTKSNDAAGERAKLSAGLTRQTYQTNHVACRSKIALRAGCQAHN